MFDYEIDSITKTILEIEKKVALEKERKKSIRIQNLSCVTKFPYTENGLFRAAHGEHLSYNDKTSHSYITSFI